MKPVILTQKQWKTIREMLQQEYPTSVFLLRSRMKERLGFTVREHKGWVPNPNYDKDLAEWKKRKPNSIVDFEPDKGNVEFRLHLDFYSQNKRTMFLLKFSDIIGNSSGH